MEEEFSGDPRRCAKHGEVTSSPDGMHDGLRGACESEMDNRGLEEEESRRCAKHGVVSSSGPCNYCESDMDAEVTR